MHYKCTKTIKEKKTKAFAMHCTHILYSITATFVGITCRKCLWARVGGGGAAVQYNDRKI